MKIGISICAFDYSGEPASIGPTIARVAQRAEQGGVDTVWVMDHFFQIPFMGDAEQNMLEAYTALGYLAAQTETVNLGTLVSGVTYRNPGLLVKAATTLDVLSGGRAWFGVGAAWFEREHTGLGFGFPPLGTRFEMLEEMLEIAGQMWSDDDGPYEGRHYTLAETLGLPRPVSSPRPRILIGGSGEKKTLRLVARFADACNVHAMGPAEVRRKYDVLEQHCADIGRDPSEIQKTILTPGQPVDDDSADRFIEEMQGYAEVGVEVAMIGAAQSDPMPLVDTVADKVVPAIADL